MPKRKVKNSSFNLIRKELDERRSFRGEKSWYMTFNFLIIATVVAFSGLSFVFSIYLDHSLDSKKSDLVTAANTKVYNTQRSFIKSKINVLNDKFSLYQDVKSQNFDMNKFYTSLTQIYSNVSIKKFVILPEATTVSVDLEIPSNAYSEFPKFVFAINNNARFNGYLIRSVNFVNTTSDTTSASDTAAQISILVPRVDPNELVN